MSSVGENIVSADNLYEGTYSLFNNTFPEFGREIKFVDSQNLNAFENAIDSKTKALYAESLGNPKLNVPDFKELAKIAHENDIPLIVDNTSAVGLVKLEHWLILLWILQQNSLEDMEPPLEE